MNVEFLVFVVDTRHWLGTERTVFIDTNGTLQA